MEFKEKPGKDEETITETKSDLDNAEKQERVQCARTNRNHYTCIPLEGLYEG